MIKREGLRWKWVFYDSSRGYAEGWTWTKRGAKKKLRDAMIWFYVDNR